MPEWADRTLHHRHKIGFKRVLRQRRAVQAMSCLLTRSPSTFPAVTWLFIGGRLKAWAVSIPNITKRGMTSIFAGVSSRLDGSLLSVQPQSSGTTGVLLFALSYDSRMATAKRNRCSDSSI